MKSLFQISLNKTESSGKDKKWEMLVTCKKTLFFASTHWSLTQPIKIKPALRDILRLNYESNGKF